MIPTNGPIIHFIVKIGEKKEQSMNGLNHLKGYEREDDGRWDIVYETLV